MPLRPRNVILLLFTGTQSTAILPVPYPCAFFFFNDTATTEIYTLSLHDALPICFASSAVFSVSSALFSCASVSPAWVAFSASLLSASLRAARASRSCSTSLYRTVETQAVEAPPTTAMAPAAHRARARTCAVRRVRREDLRELISIGSSLPSRRGSKPVAGESRDRSARRK